MLAGDAPQISVAVGLSASANQIPHGQASRFSAKVIYKTKSCLIHFGNETSSARSGSPASPSSFAQISWIGALPIVVLGPLGAVSLLYNAFFARVILGDEFSVHLVLGTIFIAGGAVLIGTFGVVPEQTHTLDELVRLYSRPPFIIWISLLSAFLAVLLTTAHITEWAFERQCRSHDSTTTPSSPVNVWRHRSRRDSHTSRPTLLNHSHSAPNESIPRYGAFEDTTSRPPNAIPLGLDGVPHVPKSSPNQSWKRSVTMAEAERELTEEAKPNISDVAIERTRVILGVAYGAASGTLSGLCLLFAKTGIELLILTIVGQNQFGHYQAWLIVLVLLVAAVLQLFYLNRALRLLGPHLVCPLAFCAYNLSSIITGLIYYDQWDMLSSLQIGLVSLGTVILLAGVWIVSNKAERKEAKEKSLSHTQFGALAFTEEPQSDGDESDADSILSGPVEWIPRGLTIGIGAASPGFDIRPSHRRHIRTSTLPTSNAAPNFDVFDAPEHQPLLIHRVASEADTEEAANELHARKRKDRTRGVSISGGLFVGVGPRSRLSHDTNSAPCSPLAPSQNTNTTLAAEDEEGEPGPDAAAVRAWKRASVS
ncbi:magnesium transporter, partial [Phenoliferia sp. Uapishka_3]